MNEYRTCIDVMDAIIAGKITDAEGAEIIDKINEAQGRVGCWSGHDGPEIPEPNSDYPESVMFDEPEHGKNGYCRKCHSYCYGDCN